MSKIASTFSRKERSTGSPIRTLAGFDLGTKRTRPIFCQSGIRCQFGLALYQGKEVAVRPFSGTSVLSPGQVTDATETIARILSPWRGSTWGQNAPGLFFVSLGSGVNLRVLTREGRASRSPIRCRIGSLPGQGGCGAPVLRHFGSEPWPPLDFPPLN
jgi:hypothetical protein